jgi:hypothetical protein
MGVGRILCLSLVLSTTLVAAVEETVANTKAGDENGTKATNAVKAEFR